jgi:ActR/RegA family two-component response regulator
MPTDVKPRILCVDDDASVLEGLGRTLRRQFTIETCTDPLAAVGLAGGPEPFAVVLSDMRMPGLNGAEFLARVREISPDTVRVLLTGYADVEAAIAAVNRGRIFRFLSKPCNSQELISSRTQAAEQYRLVTTERVLLEQTLRGSVEALTNILALVHPAAFGRATRASKQVRTLIRHFQVSEGWSIEVAAMLSQIGCVVLPPHAVEALYRGDALGSSEQQMVDRMPQVVEELLEHIPRLEPVRAILRLTTRNYHDLTANAATPAPLAWGASALKIVLEYDELQSCPESAGDAVRIMRGRRGRYNPEIFEAFVKLCGPSEEGKIRELAISELRLGMTLAEDVKTSKGLLLIARGQQMTPSLIERIRNFSATVGIREPLRVDAAG